MADTTILNGDIGVTWWNNNRQKRLEWIGGTNPDYTMNQLYSAMQTLQDETTTIDDGTAFSAETPVEYTVGKIDSGDTEPWYISFDLMEHIKGGALRTSGWSRVTDSNNGIIVVPGVNVNMTSADQGYDVTGATTGAGTILELIETGGAIDYLVIRPDGSASANDFVTASQTITSARGAFTFTQWATASSTTGDQIWANIYSIGTIDPNVHLYVSQGPVDIDGDRVRLASWNDNTQDWYGNGHIDILVALKDIEATTWSIIDGGFLSIFARKSGDLYASFEAANSTTSGGRNPVPLQTAVDLDQSTGIKKELTGTWTGTYVNGEIITGGSSGARGIVDFANSSDGVHLVYFPIDDPQIDFENAEVITGATSGATSTSSGTPADFGPADATWFSGSGIPTVVFGEQQADIDNDGTDEQYGILIDCNQNRLSEVYEWCKWQTRNGEQTNDLDGIDGEQYLGGEVFLYYGDTETITGTLVEGDDVTQETTGATGIVVSLDTTSKTVLLRNTRGTFATGSATSHTVTGEQAGFFEMETADNAVASTFAPKTASPLGTFAGGTFFGARGTLLTDWHSSDENAFILTAIPGGTYQRPTSIQLEVTNLFGGAKTLGTHDRVGIFRLLAGVIERDEYAVSGTPAAGDATISVGTTIAVDTPATGSIVIVDSPGVAGATEYKVRYSSWLTSTFTLANAIGTADDIGGTTSDTVLNDSGASFNTTALRGDLIYTAKGIGYVKTVDSDTQLTLEGIGISGLVATDAYELNAVPVALTTADDIYVPFMDRIATAPSEAVSIIYDAPIDFRVKVRNTRAATKIKPYSSDGSSSGTNQSIPTVRTEDTVIS